MSAVDELLLKWTNGDLSSEEKAELSKHYSISELDQFIADTGQLRLETNEVGSEWNKLKPKLQPTNSNYLIKYLVWLIPLLLLLIAGIWYFTTLCPDKTIENKTYEPMLIAMEDDTEIMLAPGSTVSFNTSSFTGDRKIWLEGRAYFDVKQKGDFSVVTEDGIVSVLGTTFDIWELGEGKLIVQCFTGKVNVATSAGMGADLIAGQKYTESIGVSNIGDEVKPKWLSNSIVFEAVPLSIVYKDLEKYYPVKFVGELSNLNFNGELPTDNLQKVTEILNAVTSDTYKIENEKVVVSKSE